MANIKTNLVEQPATGPARDVHMVIAVNADGSAIGGGSGGGAVDQGAPGTTPWPVEMIGGHFRRYTDGVDHSGSITAADTWQLVLPRNVKRTAITIHNPNDEGILIVTTQPPASVTGKAKTYPIGAGQSFFGFQCNALHIKSSIAGLEFTCEETED